MFQNDATFTFFFTIKSVLFAEIMGQLPPCCSISIVFLIF